MIREAFWLVRPSQTHRHLFKIDCFSATFFYINRPCSLVGDRFMPPLLFILNGIVRGREFVHFPSRPLRFYTSENGACHWAKHWAASGGTQVEHLLLELYFYYTISMVSQTQLICYISVPVYLTPNTEFNPRFTPPFIWQMRGLTPG
jgi:hypothetical protein